MDQFIDYMISSGYELKEREFRSSACIQNCKDEEYAIFQHVRRGTQYLCSIACDHMKLGYTYRRLDENGKIFLVNSKGLCFDPDGKPRDKAIKFIHPLEAKLGSKTEIPSWEIQEEMKNWDQGGEQWKKWRCQNETIGQSTMGNLVLHNPHYLIKPDHQLTKEEKKDYLNYHQKITTNRSFFDLLRKKPDTSDIFNIEGIYTKAGHSFEEINRRCTESIIKSLVIKGRAETLKIKEYGVLFHQKKPGITASLDGSVECDDDVFINVGLIYPIKARTLLVEAKCPTFRMDDNSPKEDYKIQQQGQLEVARSFIDMQEKGEEFKSLAQKEYSILSVMQLTEEARSRDFENEKMHFFKGRKWVLRIWLVKYNEKTIEDMELARNFSINAYNYGMNEGYTITPLRMPKYTEIGYFSSGEIMEDFTADFKNMTINEISELAISKTNFFLKPAKVPKDNVPYLLNTSSMHF